MNCLAKKFCVTSALVLGCTGTSQFSKNGMSHSAVAATDAGPSRTDSKVSLTVTQAQFSRRPKILPTLHPRGLLADAVKLQVFVGYKGSKPSWWGRPTRIFIQDVMFVSTDGKEYRFPTVFMNNLPFNAQRNNYTVEWFCRSSQWPLAVKSGVFKATIQMTDTSIVSPPGSKQLGVTHLSIAHRRVG
jgi:hypothetical protein